MTRNSKLASAVGILLLVAPATADIESGIPVGSSVKGFNPMLVTGPDAGKSACLVCAHGSSPVVAIFAREIDDSLVSLVKKVDEATAKNKKKAMGSFVVFLDKSDAMVKQAKALAEKAQIKETTLALDNSSGPKGYNIAQEANVTVIMYVDHKVKARFAFAKGKLSAVDIDKVMNELPKILED